MSFVSFPIKRASSAGRASRLPALSLLCLLACGCAGSRAAFLSAAPHGSSAWLLHLPGVAGEQWLDRDMVRGLREGGFDGTIEIYDWTDHDPGLGALLAHQRNTAQAQKIADLIARHVRDDPAARVYIICHSGGAGLAAWALEDLPADVKVDTVVFLAPALSRRYDLSAALSHVRGNAFVFSSTNDVLVLGMGTKMFGTIDGVKEEAAGKEGFIQPDGADPSAYAKIVHCRYRAEWMSFDNIGDHIGPMSRQFIAKVVAPLAFAKDEMEGPRASPGEFRVAAATQPAGPSQR